MKKRVEKVVKEKAAGNVEDEFSKIADDYQCSGSLEMDFPELCSLLGMKEIPAVTPRPPASRCQSHCFCHFIGWKVDELMARVLNKTLPALSNLQNLHLWRAGLTGRTLTSLKNTISLCSNLRTVVLEGNPLPEQSYHLLISEDSMLTHVSLRNNRIGEEGARLIGSALATAQAANNNLLSLNLAFNSIGDAGAAHIAQGLRLNRSLLCLSLANNHIGDTGASRLAEVLGPFSLTHDEVVERRRLLLRRDQSVRERTAHLHTTFFKFIFLGLGQSHSFLYIFGAIWDTGQIFHPVSLHQSAELVETVSPLLEPGVQHTGGRVILPGNTALTSLNLAGNMLSEQSLLLFLSSVGAQTEGGGLLRLCLNRNRFPPDCDSFLKIKELMSLRDPLNKTAPAQVDDEQGQAA
uniref:Leucine rich repeat containing 71 n=1 Tax=Salmo trutta TaxID=8032 RepID=A0A674CJK0_SALTR